LTPVIGDFPFSVKLPLPQAESYVHMHAPKCVPSNLLDAPSCLTRVLLADFQISVFVCNLRGRPFLQKNNSSGPHDLIATPPRWGKPINLWRHPPPAFSQLFESLFFSLERPITATNVAQSKTGPPLPFPFRPISI